MKASLIHNLGLKLLALVAAAICWLAIQEAINYELAVPDVPLEVRVEDGWAVMRQSVASIRVTFRGADQDLRLLDAKQLRAVVEAPVARIAGSGILEITPDAVRAPRTVRAVQVTPDRVEVSLDRREEKKVPVKGRTTGRPEVGDVEAVICDPAVVLLRGPAQQVRQTDWVYTEPLDVGGWVESMTRRARVVPPGDTWTAVIEPADVQVQVVLSNRADTMAWDDVPVAAALPPGARQTVELNPARVRIVATGRMETLAALKDTPPKALVECRGLDSSLTYELPVQVYTAPGRWVDAAAEPRTVRVKLQPF